jgi:hypothetical protein
MSLIFIKTHLKDKEVRFDEDRGITLAIETLENKDILFSKLGLFFLLATNIEKILAEYIFEKTKNDSFRDSPLGVKEKEFNKVVVSYTDERYRNITSKLADFRKRRNDITHKTIIVDPKYFSNIFYINWRNQEMSDEISSDEYVKYLDTSIDIGRNLLADLVTLFLYEDLEEKKFIEARELTTKMPFGFHNKHC